VDSPAQSPDSIAKRLADSGLRPTAQREIVYKAILGKRNHPSTDEIFARVKAQMPTISLATVYNCLEALVQCGLVKQVNFERTPTRYCPNLREHAHFHDDATGVVHDIDVPVDILDRLRALLPEGYSATSIELSFHGRSSKTADAATPPPASAAV
jgi:Fur family peroxide stress response transcriptional regulator